MNRSDDDLTTYRGQNISANELNQLQCNSNFQISMNTFMSTSENRNAALAFIAGFENTQQRKRVLFQIKISPDFKSVIYADISHLSNHKNEEEVLFNLGTVFRITAVLFDEEFDVWTIKMTAIDNAFEYLEDFLKLKNNEMKNYSSTIVFGRLLIYELGQPEKAENYFQMLLNTLPNDHEDLPSVYHNLGSVYRQKGEVKSALEYYLKAYHLGQEEYHPNHPHIASSLRNIGLTYYAKKDYITALKYLGDTLKIEETNSLEDDENKAVTMVHLGMAYNGEKQYVMALEYLSNAYQMYQRILPEKHPDIGWAASRIGFCYEHQQNYDGALHYYSHAYEIDKTILCSEHQDLTEDLNRIVSCYLKQSKYEMATTITKKILAEQTLKLVENHPRIGYTLLTIAQIYQSDNHFEEALAHYEQSLRIFEQCFPFDQKPILECLIAKSELVFQYGHFESALSIRLEVLSLQEKLFSSVHISIAQSLLFIGQLYKHARNYHQALEYFDKSSKIYHIQYESDHADVKYVLNEIEMTKNESSNDEIDESRSNE